MGVWKRFDYFTIFPTTLLPAYSTTQLPAYPTTCLLSAPLPPQQTNLGKQVESLELSFNDLRQYFIKFFAVFEL